MEYIGRMKYSWSFRVLRVAIVVLLLGRVAPAQQVRIATFNVELGIAGPDTPKGRAQRAILKRVNADIVALQELNAKTSNEWVRLAEDLGYPHRAWGEMGPFSGSMTVGYFSRFPILESGSVISPEGAKEFSRYPLRITVRVPGAARPLTLWNMHHKAMFMPPDEYRRAVEAFRIAQDVIRVRGSGPDAPACIVLGDMNDDIVRGTKADTWNSVESKDAQGGQSRHPQGLQSPQTVSFETPPPLSKSYAAGPDVPSPMPYRAFPLDAYGRPETGLAAVEAYREGTRDNRTHLYTNYRLDYLLISGEIRGADGKPPVGEIYYSGTDKGGGLPKAGEPLPPDLSLAASDHYPVFADLTLQGVPPPQPPPE
jgi:endonuclease/exonuclease/phosphatase family metal-dependent hydrolase